MPNIIELNLLQNKSIVATMQGYPFGNENSYKIIAGEENATIFKVVSIPNQYKDKSFTIEMVNTKGYGIAEAPIADINNYEFYLPVGMAVAGYSYILFRCKYNENGKQVVVPFQPLKIKVWNTIPQWQDYVDKTTNVRVENGYLILTENGNEYNLGYVKGEKGDIPDDYVTLDTVQVITKPKTFSDGLTLLDADLFERVETFHTAKSIHRYIYDGWGEIRSKCTFEYPEKGSGEYTFATTEDVAMVETKTEENAETIKFHEKVLFQSGIVGVLEKSQAYTARETAEGANIVDGQTTPVLEIAGDTVKSSNLFYVNGYMNEAWNELSITFDESTQEFTINGTVAQRGNITLSSLFKIANVSSAKTYTVAIIKVSGSVTFPASGSNSILLSVFDKNNANYYMPSRVILSQSLANGVSVAMATAGIDATNLIVYMQLVNSDLGEFVFDNYKFKIQIVEGSYGTNNLPAYQPYFAGLKNAFINSIKSTGTNLFNPSLYDGIETNADKMATTKVYVNNATPVLFKGEPNTEYTIAIYDTDKNASGFNGFSFNANGTWINHNSKVGVFTTNENGEIYLQAGASAYTTIGKTGYVAIFKGKYAFSTLPNYNPYKENTYQLPETLELGKWDKFDAQTGILTRGTGTVTSETAFTEEQIASYKNAIVSADGLSLAYELDTPTTETLTDIPKTYTAWKNGSEMIIQGETDNSAYGAMPTVTQTYFEVLGGVENE